MHLPPTRLAVHDAPARSPRHPARRLAVHDTRPAGSRSTTPGSQPALSGVRSRERLIPPSHAAG